MAGGEKLYGGYALKLGDGDIDLRYGAIVRPNMPGDPVPAPGAVGFVAQLQQDLTKLGFLEANESTAGTFDDVLKWAVREFQIMASASGKGGAQLTDPTYVGTLSAARLARHALSGPEIYSKGEGVSGIAGPTTAEAIAAWINGNLRCPVVFQSYDVIVQGNGKLATRTFNLVEEGFWRASRKLKPPPSGRGKHTSVFACDFTGEYDGLPALSTKFLPASVSDSRLFPVGQRSVYGKGTNQTIGPGSTTANTLTGTDERAIVGVSPATLIGHPNPTPAELSTYRVMRAVAQAECFGLFDSINSYDTLRVSCGLYHLGGFNNVPKGKGRVTKGELGAFFAYLKDQEAAIFDKTLTNRGVAVSETWGEAGNYNSSQAKYEANFALEGQGGKTAAITAGVDADYLRNWPWFYRFEMAFRSSKELRLLWWAYGRQRLADILSTPWGPAPVPGGGSSATIGAVFRSEASVAALLRWHVVAPARIVNGGVAGSAVVAAFVSSGIDTKKMLSQYTSDDERGLFNGLLDAAADLGSKQLNRDLDMFRSGSNGKAPSVPLDQDSTVMPLGTDRTFKYFGDGIPFPRAVPT